MNTVFSKVVALGVTGNYVDRSLIRSWYNDLARKGYPVTFFHPLRIIGGRLAAGLEGSGNKLVTGLVASGVIRSDSKNFKKRFTLLASSLPSSSHIRVVVHTEYAAPFWCDETFQKAYFNTVPAILEYVNRVARERLLDFEAIIEIHPGFTNIQECRVGGGRLRCNSVERDQQKLAYCLSQFRRELLERAGIGLRFSIEPRAGSIVQGRRRTTEQQTLSNHREAYLFAKQNNLSLVIDPGQTILKRISPEEAWTEVFDIARSDPNIVDEVHIHSFTARGGRGHGLPSEQELQKYAELINQILRSRTRILGAVFEVLRSSTKDLIQVASRLLDHDYL